jgi:hypothetical protein
MMTSDVVIPWWWYTLGQALCYVVITVVICYEKHLLFIWYNTLLELLEIGKNNRKYNFQKRLARSASKQ